MKDGIEVRHSPKNLIISKNEELTVRSAQQWYNANNKPVSELRSASGREGKLVMLWWEKAKEHKRGKRYEVVEIPVKAERATVFVDKETQEKVKSKVERDKVINVARMVILISYKSARMWMIAGIATTGMKMKAMPEVAAFYREWIVDRLREMDPTQTNETYEALAWVGLRETTAWKEKTKEYQDRMKKIALDFVMKGGEPYW